MDQWTGLYHRHWFLQRLEEEISEARRYSRPVSCLALALDPPEPGSVLQDPTWRQFAFRATASLVRHALRVEDVCALGDEETLLILLPSTEKSGATALARRLCQTIGQQPFLESSEPGAWRQGPGAERRTQSVQTSNAMRYAPCAMRSVPCAPVPPFPNFPISGFPGPSGESSLPALRLTVSLGVASLFRDGIGPGTALVDMAEQRLRTAQEAGGNQIVAEDTAEESEGRPYPIQALEQRPARLLIMDQDTSVRKLVAVKMEAAGYVVFTAESGARGLAAIDRQRPDLVILDMMMPEMNGYEVLRQIRVDRRQVDLPVIVCTARRMIQDIVEGLDAGADDYVTKPFDPMELLARVKACLRLKHLRDSLQRSEEQYRLLAENSPDVIFRADLRGRFEYVNAAVWDQWGYEPSRFLALTWSDLLLATDDNEAAREALRRAPKGEIVQPFPAEIRHAEGAARSVEIALTPVLQEGEVIAIQGVARDLTERKRLEARLVEAERLAAIGEIGVTINHEINNPLTAVLGYASTLLDTRENLPADVRRKIETIYQMGLRIRDVVQKLDSLRVAVTMDYVRGGQRMIDLNRAAAPGSQGSAGDRRELRGKTDGHGHQPGGIQAEGRDL